MAKNSFVLYKDQCAGLENLPDEDAGKFFKHIIRYQLHEEIPSFSSGYEATLFSMFRSQFDRDSEKYAQECEKKAENGKKGGLARASKCLQVPADAGKSKQFQPDNDNDNENDIIKEKLYKKKNSNLFSKPSSLEEVTAYGNEIELTPDQAEAFYDHFESNGWKVGGKTQMKDWKAALRNWKRNARPQTILSTQTHAQTFQPAQAPEKPSKKQMLFYALNQAQPLYKVNLNVFYDYQDKNGWPGDWRQKLAQWYLRCMENENNPARRFLTLVDLGDAVAFREFAGPGTGQVQINELYGIRLPIKKADYKEAV